MAPKNYLDAPALHYFSVMPSSHSITKSPTASSNTSHERPPPPGRRAAPIVRVVQISPPKMIQTSVANFRALVQELTGNSAGSDLDESVTSDKPRKGNGHKKRKATSRSAATPADRPEVGMAPVSAQLQNSVFQKQHFEPSCEQPRDNGTSGAVQSAEEPVSCLQQRVDYVQTTDHHEDAFVDVRSISYCGAWIQDLPISRSYSFENSGYVDQNSLVSSDLDILSSLNTMLGSSLSELNQFALGSNLPELYQFAPIPNTCHNQNSLLQQQLSYRFPVSPVFPRAYDFL